MMEKMPKNKWGLKKEKKIWLKKKRDDEERVVKKINGAWKEKKRNAKERWWGKIAKQVNGSKNIDK